MKILFLLFLIIFSLNATSVKNRIVLEKEISKDNIKYKNLKELDLKKELFKKVFFKLTINKEMIKDKSFYLKINCDLKSIKQTNLNYEIGGFDSIIFKLDKTTPKTIILDFEFEKKQLLNFSFATLSSFEYKYILKKESLLYGFAYGIIFCAFIYNFALFLYNRQKSFLFYSLMQFLLMLILYYNVTIENQTYSTKLQQITVDILETMCIIFILLFSKEILNTKNMMKFSNKILNFLISINIIDLIGIFFYKYSVLYSYVPRSIIILILVIIGFFALFKAQKVAIFYFLGWFIVLLSLYTSEHEFFDVSELYILHIGLPLESLILSFALGYKLKLSMDQKKERENLLVKQNRLAAMGEMLNNIAHQWRQPLNNLSFINLDLKMAIKSNDINISYLEEIANDSEKQITFMSDTLENFKGFYQPNRKKEKFLISCALNDTISIIKSTLDKENIKIDLNIKKDKEITSYKNELIQVILNLLTNAKDALLENKIENPFIEIFLDINKKNKVVLTIQDNAKGIAENIIYKIFDPYFTTKNQNTGIGLYMSKIIISSHLKGEISVKNENLGACFKIII